ncbi:hypothetical protein BDV93DRAFT_564221 [Ceratobasidium sp. AG-I]|nr:hypothetical protein BDV93DRAFT_564221 [Ceratobasidium sp. AG-I]
MVRALTAKQFPLDLVLYVSEHCSQATLASLMLLNKSCSRTIMPILYSDVSLKTLEQIRTLKSQLSSDALFGKPIKSLSIGSVETFAAVQEAPLGTLVRSTLSLLPNLKTLKVHLSSDIIPEVIADSNFPFQLTHLTIPPTTTETFNSFLESQRSLESLVLSSIGSGEPWSPHATPICSPPAHALPNLRHLEADAEAVMHLARNRPLSTVHVVSDIYYLALGIFGTSFEQTSAPLKSLAITVIEDSWEFDLAVMRVVSSIKDCRGSLKDLTVRVVPGVSKKLQSAASVNGLFKTKRPKPTMFKQLSQILSSLVVLEKFHLEYKNWKDDLTPEFCSRVPEFASLGAWKDHCPLLTRVSLFGVAIEA